jgi:hypothetical protein
MYGELTVWFARLKAYLLGVVWKHEEAALMNFRNTRALIKRFFDLVRNILITGGLWYLALKSDSLLLKVMWDMASASIMLYCLSYLQTLRLRVFHPWWPARWARVADFLVSLVVVAPLLYLLLYTMPMTMREIAKAQATIPSTIPPPQASPEDRMG